MTAEPTKLPSFNKPPVHEVALALVFEPIPGFQSRHIGEVWSAFKDRFPHVEEQAPIERQIEQFGPSVSPRVQLQFLRQPELRRQWFVSADQSELLQLQDDRFTRNWRRIAGKEYPRFERLRDSLVNDWSQFATVLNRERLPLPRFIQCEVDYVNHIDSSNGFTDFMHAPEVFKPLGGGFSDGFLSNCDADGVQAQLSFPISFAGGKQAGRLRVVLDGRVSVSDPKKKLLRLTLSARGKPIGAGLTGAIEFMNLGREWIVRGFASVTTEKMHRLWERTDV